MTSREIMKAVLTFDHPPRIGMTFPKPYPNDLLWGIASPSCPTRRRCRPWATRPGDGATAGARSGPRSMKRSAGRSWRAASRIGVLVTKGEPAGEVKKAAEAIKDAIK